MASMVIEPSSSTDVVPEDSDVVKRDARVRAVVAEHYDFVWRSLRRLGIDETSAYDEAQQVFCVFARRAPEIPEGKEKSFLFGAAIRVAQAARRTAARRSEWSDDDALAQVAAKEPGADQLLEEARARAMLDRWLDEMPMDLRAVFILYELEEMTMADIATTLSLPPGTVASRLRRAREKFQEFARRASELDEGGAR